IRPSVFPAGEIRVGRARLRVAATLGDQQAALLGVGCARRGEMVINYGTGAFAALNTRDGPVRAPGLLTSVAWSSEQGVRYLLEGTVNAAGGAVDWMEKVTAPARSRSRRSLKWDLLPIVIPGFSGLGAPHWRSDAGAAIFDLAYGAGPAELHAATLAGIACRVREIVERMERNGRVLRRIVAAGGLLRSRGLLEIQADLLGRALFRSGVEDATARGAAILAGHALGAWDLERGPALTPRARRVSGARGRKAAEAYYRRFVSRMDSLLASTRPAGIGL
ncbi:MAG: FGGY-family carbohydrate kinase, partial [Gemmatimonadales bacterium]